MCIICKGEDISQLTKLDCSGCKTLTELPPLPAGLQWLLCADTNLTFLPQLPDGLTMLVCHHCKFLTDLPELPDSLNVLGCNNCTALTKLPDLPVGLEVLSCDRCSALTEIPNLPLGLAQLFCDKTAITAIPPLPIGLRAVSCCCTDLTELPQLPPTLVYLKAENCRLLFTLPQLPNGLETLMCKGSVWLPYNRTRNMGKLIVLQKNFRTLIFKRRIALRNILKNAFCRDLAGLINAY
jgi:hypothetical protein